MSVEVFGQIEQSGVDVGSSLDEFYVQRVLEVEFEGRGCSLESTPEGLLSFFDDVVFWEGAEQVFDLVIEDVLEDVDCQFKTHVVRSLVVGLIQLLYALQFSSQSGWVLPVLLLELFEEGLSVFVEVEQVAGGFCEGAFEVVASPLDGVVDLVGEVLESAEGDAFLGRVDNVSIADCDVRDDDLRVALRT